MKAVCFKGRVVVVVKMEDGEFQPFYKSTGRNSGRAGVWFPFDGWVDSGGGLFLKSRFCDLPKDDPMYRFGKEKFKDVSDRLSENLSWDIDTVNEGIEVNTFIYEEIARLSPERRG